MASGPSENVRVWRERLAERGWWHSFELPDGTLIEGSCDLAGLKRRLAQFPIPEDLRGNRVLDVGAWDGWFSFEMERRGAEVLAIDVEENTRFHEMKELLGSRVEHRYLDVYDLDPRDAGRFDIVLFLGVLYHLKHPLLGLERVCAVTKDFAAVDSFVLREEHRPGSHAERRPILEFYETDEFGGQTDNWFGPSVPCLLALCRTAGFARVELLSRLPDSACVGCWRRWEPVPENASAAPRLLEAFHATNYGLNFTSPRDEYVTVYFDAPGPAPVLDDVKPEVGGYGVRPIHVSPVEDRYWQANIKLPPGLPPGWHEVRLRVRDSAPSGPLRVAVDVPLSGAPVSIAGMCDGQTWVVSELDLRRGRAISIWVAGLPENADRNNVRVEVGGRRAKVMFVEPPKGERPRQVNAEVADGLPAGAAELVVEAGAARSASISIELKR